MGFFDDFPEFITEGSTGVRGNRLNYRYQAIIERQKEALAGASVLDLASHDGRWSLAALACGAAAVTGVEARPELALKSRRLLGRYGYEADRFEVIVDDCIHALSTLAIGQFDVVLCLGFFYHTMHHFRLLSEIRRLRPRLLVLDTLLTSDEFPGVRFRLEDTAREGSSVRTVDHDDEALVGIVTEGGLAMMLRHLGWQHEYVDWGGLGLPDWHGIEDYRDWQGAEVHLRGRRHTILVRPVA